MPVRTTGDTRTRLIDAAASLIAASPGQDISLRAVCDHVGVKMPTLYHFFGSKQGLLDAVTERGFELYLAQKDAAEGSADPIQDLREGWDLHVGFGIANPGFYALMYGTVRPGYSPAARERPARVLLELTTAAADQGRLVVSAEQAAAHILATNVGVTLRQIIRAEADPALSAAVREGAIAAITGTDPSTAGETARTRRHRAAHQLIEDVARDPSRLGAAESQLLTEWLTRLAELPD